MIITNNKLKMVKEFLEGYKSEMERVEPYAVNTLAVLQETIDSLPDTVEELEEIGY